MKIRNIIIAVTTVVVVVAAWNTSREHAPTTELSSDLLYPQLDDNLNKVARVSIRTAEDATELAKSGNDWVVANRDNFPAKFSDVKSLLMHIANSKIIEEKTSKSDRYAQIGVSDISEPDSEGSLVQAAANDGALLVDLIVGNERSGSQTGARQYYVRRASTPTALLAEGELNVNSDPGAWMDTSLVNVASERVRKVTVTRADDAPLVITKAKAEDNFFTLEGIPDGFVEKSRAIVSSLGAVLLDLKFQDVASGSKITDRSPTSSTEVRTFDGLVAHLERFELDDKQLVRLRFDFDPAGVVPAVSEPPKDTGATGGITTTADATPAEAPPSVADEVAALNAKVADWVYALPDYKIRMLEKNLSEMIKPIEKEKTPTE